MAPVGKQSGSNHGTLRKMLIISPEQLERLKGETLKAMKASLGSEMKQVLAKSTIDDDDSALGLSGAVAAAQAPSGGDENQVEKMYREWGEYRPLLDKFLDLKRKERKEQVKIPICEYRGEEEEGEEGEGKDRALRAPASRESPPRERKPPATAPASAPARAPAIAPASAPVRAPASAPARAPARASAMLDFARPSSTSGSPSLSPFLLRHRGVPVLPPRLQAGFDYERDDVPLINLDQHLSLMSPTSMTGQKRKRFESSSSSELSLEEMLDVISQRVNNNSIFMSERADDDDVGVEERGDVKGDDDEDMVFRDADASASFLQTSPSHFSTPFNTYQEADDQKGAEGGQTPAAAHDISTGSVRIRRLRYGRNKPWTQTQLLPKTRNLTSLPPNRFAAKEPSQQQQPEGMVEDDDDWLW